MSAQVETKPTRPLLRWHGGKFGKAGVLADWVLAHVPPHECYVEPFGGGASVLLRKWRTLNEVYNDQFGEVVTLFRVLRAPALRDELIAAVSLTPFAESEQRASFARPEGESEVETARRLLIRSWQSFGHDASSSYRSSGFRAGTKTAVRDPGLDWRGLPASLALIADRLQGVHIYERPYEYILRKYDGPQTAFYVDPPYLSETRTEAHRAAYAFEMSDQDHVDLADRLHTLEGMVTLSGYDSGLYEWLYGSWHRVERKTFANGRGARKPERLELLWMNEAAHRALETQKLQPSMFGRDR